MHLAETIPSGFFFLVLWIVFAPALGLLINLIFGKRISETMVGIVASLASGAAFVVSVLLAWSVAANNGEVLRWQLAEWIHIGNLQLDWTFRVDSLSTTMMLVVSGVGTLIHIYAIGYMHEDVRHKHDEGRFPRFFVFLNLFIAMMMILVSGDSYLLLFVGWEGVGLCSFLLIGFWYELDTLGRLSWANSNAAKKAFIVNRIGDFGFMIAAFIMFWNFHSLQFDQVFQVASTVTPGVVLAITLLLLVGVAGKSAQIPLYVWLPDAMAGPTPVSALIHAATMVTAGVYLTTRSAPLYTLVPQAQFIVALTGAVTALFAATIAVGQYDIKKVLAYSTISQLGFMVAAVGMGAFVAGMFHLVTHAFFKALLFLSAGSVILGLERGHHLSHHEARTPVLADDAREGHEGNHSEEVFDANDMRNMGGLRKTMPITFWLYVIGTLALAGIFPFAGSRVITVPLMILAFLSIVGGALNLPGLHTLTAWLEHTIEVHAGEFVWSIAIISTVLALVGIYISWLIYGRNPLRAGETDPLKRRLGAIFTGAENKWYVDELYQAIIVTPFIKISQFLADVIDWRFWHDWFHETAIAGTYNWLSNIALNRYADQQGIDAVANSLGDVTQWLSATLRKIQNGFVRSYALSVLLGVVLIVGYLILK